MSGGALGTNSSGNGSTTSSTSTSTSSSDSTSTSDATTATRFACCVEYSNPYYHSSYALLSLARCPGTHKYTFAFGASVADDGCAAGALVSRRECKRHPPGPVAAGVPY